MGTNKTYNLRNTNCELSKNRAEIQKTRGKSIQHVLKNSNMSDKKGKVLFCYYLCVARGM